MKVANLLLVIILIVSKDNPIQIQAFRVIENEGEVTIFALQNEPVSIQCRKDIPMSYCGFVDPSGKRYSFSGNELNNGHCAIKTNATTENAGIWTCHVGGKTAGLELVQKIDLRVVNEIAALVKNVTAEHGDPVTLECATTQGYFPLSYCRFEPPKDTPFSINQAVTRKNTNLRRYYFPRNRSLDRGDCAVTIHQAKYDDVGIWTCGAGMSDGKEYTDSIMVTVNGLYTMSTATSVGLIFGVLAIFCILIALGYIAWYKHMMYGVARAERNAADNDGHEMGDIVARPPGSATPIRRSPTGSFRSPPGLVVQSPSEPGSSPLMP